MGFTDTDKRALIELINNIYHNFSSGGAPTGADLTNVTLPCRLLRSAAEVAANVYGSEIVGNLDNSELELLLTYLSKAVEAVAGSLGQVTAALPREPPAGMAAKLARQADSLRELKAAREALFATADTLSEQEAAILAEQRQLAELRQRRDFLIAARARWAGADLAELRRMVSEMETELGPAQSELELLQQEAAEKESETDAISRAVASARERIGALDQRSEDEFAKLAAVADDLLAGMSTNMARCDRSIAEVLQEIAEKSVEGRRVREQLKVRAEEVHKVYEGTRELADALNLYAAANHRTARSIPAVLDATKEKMSHIEEQLREVDRELERALTEHQTAKRVVDVVEL